jgi:hypothetical protein
MAIGCGKRWLQVTPHAHCSKKAGGNVVEPLTTYVGRSTSNKKDKAAVIEAASSERVQS